MTPTTRKRVVTAVARICKVEPDHVMIVLGQILVPTGFLRWEPPTDDQWRRVKSELEMS